MLERISRKPVLALFLLVDALLIVLVLSYFLIGQTTGSELETAHSGMSEPSRRLTSTGSPNNADILRDLGATMYPEALTINDFNLLDHNGEAFTLESMIGSWNLLFFGFSSCPDICPLTMAELSKFHQNTEQKHLLADTNIILVTVDPFKDTPEVLNRYVKGFNPDFIGLTGDFTSISRLAKDLFVSHAVPPMGAAAGSNERSENQVEEHAEHASHMSESGNDQYAIEHSGHIAVIGPDGKYRAILRFPHRYRDLLRSYPLIRELAGAGN